MADQELVSDGAEVRTSCGADSVHVAKNASGAEGTLCGLVERVVVAQAQSRPHGMR